MYDELQRASVMRVIFHTSEVDGDSEELATHSHVAALGGYRPSE